MKASNCRASTSIDSPAALNEGDPLEADTYQTGFQSEATQFIGKPHLSRRCAARETVSDLPPARSRRDRIP
jgi:hypothetical protein